MHPRAETWWCGGTTTTTTTTIIIIITTTTTTTTTTTQRPLPAPLCFVKKTPKALRGCANSEMSAFWGSGKLFESDEFPACPLFSWSL